jgi:hypothetical protein
MKIEGDPNTTILNLTAPTILKRLRFKLLTLTQTLHQPA